MIFGIRASEPPQAWRTTDKARPDRVKDKFSDHISSDVKRNINGVETDFDNSGARGGNKLRTYNLFKQKFYMKPHLLMITSKESRRNLPNLRWEP